MATTTNYGWTTPDDTALVKDGAAAIRTLGSSVDTTTKNLNPETTLGDIAYGSSTANTNTRLGIGSTGQVLTVAGGVPSWASGFANPLTTAGDTIYSSSGSTPARLAIGTAGQVLQVNSGATAPEWVTASSGGMTLLSTTTLSGASTTVSSINQTYQTLLVFIHNATWGSGNGTVYIKPNSVANQCSFIGTYWQGSAGNSGSSATDIQSYLNTTNSSGLGFAAVTFYRYANTSQWKLYSGSGANNDSGGSGVAYVYGGGVKTTSAITSLNFYPSSGANFSGGTVLIYGVK